MIGEKVAHYRIEAEIGRGGMGVVYRAEDTRLDCRRALKFLSDFVTADSAEHARLVNEARVLASLEHPNICPVQEIGEHDGRTYIVMSYLEGRSLKDRLREGPLPLREALDIARQVASALAAAHARGVVHRDVKPDNVMLVGNSGDTQGGTRAVLMDFGIAKRRDVTMATRTGTLLGTVAYMSPEQARGEEVDAAADVWAVGVMLYEMLTGRRPFHGVIEHALLYAIVHTDPEPLSGTAIPPAVEQVIGRALAKDRQVRYADAGLLAADLERALAGEAVRGRRLGRRRVRPWVSGGAAFAALLAVLLFVWPGFLMPPGTVSALAVMPLQDQSPDGDQGYFAEGVAADLENGLQKIGALTIISRNSAARARTMYATNREIGAALKVDALLEGSVQRVGDQIKVAVQLVATADDHLLWSDSYTRDLTDIFNLQGEIAMAISQAVEAELTPREREVLTKETEIDPAAYEEYLLGRHFAGLATSTSMPLADEHFRRALAIAPDFVQAQIELAGMQVLLQQMTGRSPRDAAEDARREAEKVVAMAPDRAEAHGAMALIALSFDWDLEAAGRHFARARELDPNGHNVGFAQYLNIIGRNREAAQEAELAARNDPLNPFVQANLVARYLFTGDKRKLAATVQRLQEWDPDNWILHWTLGYERAAAHDYEAAVAHFRLAAANSGENPVVKPQLVDALVKSGKAAEAAAIRGALVARSRAEYVAPYYLGQMDLSFGEMDQAIADFTLAFEERDWYLLWVNTPFATWRDDLAQDPRGQELIRKIQAFLE